MRLSKEALLFVGAVSIISGPAQAKEKNIKVKITTVDLCDQYYEKRKVNRVANAHAKIYLIGGSTFRDCGKTSQKRNVLNTTWNEELDCGSVSSEEWPDDGIHVFLEVWGDNRDEGSNEVGSGGGDRNSWLYSHSGVGKGSISYSCGRDRGNSTFNYEFITPGRSSKPNQTHAPTPGPTPRITPRPTLGGTPGTTAGPSNHEFIDPGGSRKPTRPTPQPTPGPTLTSTEGPTPGSSNHEVITHGGSSNPTRPTHTPTPAPTPGSTPEGTPGITPGPTSGPTPGSTHGGTPHMTPGPSPGITPGPTSGPTPGSTPGDTPGITPGPSPGTTPGPTSGPTPGSTSGDTPGITPGPSPGITPGPTAGPTPGSTPRGTLGPTPSPSPGITPGPTAGPTPGSTPGGTKGPTPGPSPGITPGPTFGPTLGGTQGPTPGPSPGITPGPTFGPTLGSTSGGTPGITPGPSPGITPGPTSGPTAGTTIEPTPTDPTSYGDPHFKTWSGHIYDFHGGCDLVLLHNPGFANGHGMYVHVRTSIRTWWSLIESAAVQLGDNTLQITGGLDSISYWINSQKKELETGEAFLGDFTISFRRVNDYQSQTRLDLGNHGDALSIETYKHFVRVNIKNKKNKSFDGSLGLLGAYPSGSMVGRDGKTTFEDVNDFGQEWMVRPTDTILFHDVVDNAAAQLPLKCPMPDMTAKKEAHRRLGEAAISSEEAMLVCDHVEDEGERDACIFDVLATNDKDMARSY